MRVRFAILCCLILAACNNPSGFGPVTLPPQQDLPVAGNTISLTTWNLGYGALGAGADFVTDGGENLRALPAETIAVAARDIARTAAALDPQVLFVQELAPAGFMTRSVPVKATLDAAMSGYTALYWRDLAITGLPEPLAISHGLGVYARVRLDTVRAVALPREPAPLALWFNRYFAALVNEVPIAGSNRKWVLINIHLSAFDSDGRVRLQQARAVFDLAQAAYAAGDYVVIAGDWNMRLQHGTGDTAGNAGDLFWLVDFPQELLPRGWRLAVDARTPSVRTLARPFVAGEGATAIIDGFAYSPNVRLRDVHTGDLGFAFTDHQPVSGRFVIR